MTNIELELEFYKTLKIENSFDKIIAIKELKKVYKKSDFYIQHKISFGKAYKNFKEHQLLKATYFIENTQSPEYIGELITQFLDNIDVEVVDKLVKQFTDKFDIQGVEKLRDDLIVAVKQLKP